jgi:hypothetical protein
MIGDVQQDPPFQRVAQLTLAGFLGVRVGPEAREAGNAAEDAAIFDALIRCLSHGFFDVCGEHSDLLVA